MLRRLALAALLALAPSLAPAQQAIIAPTPPTATSNNQIATTAWVNNFVNAGLPLASGKIWIGSVGNIATAQTPSGDWTISNAGVATLATVNANVGGFGSTTACVNLTVNAKGLITAISSGTCTPAIGSITGLGTGIATALAVNVGTAGAPVVNGGALGTPLSGVATNLTGTAAGLTAGNVTTNANLTGPVTSVGNATTIGANQVTRAMEAQGVARSVIGVTGNATANVADIQGTASQWFGINAAGTAAAFQTLGGDCTGAVPSIVCTKTNGTSFTSYATAAVGQLPGTTTNDSAGAGKIGEVLSANVGSGSAVALTTATPVSITSITLTAGEWDVYAYGVFVPAATTNVSQYITSISTTTNVLDTTTPFASTALTFAPGVPNNIQTNIIAGPLQFQVASTQQVYVVIRGVFTVSTMTGYGAIRARRVR